MIFDVNFIGNVIGNVIEIQNSDFILHGKGRLFGGFSDVPEVLRSLGRSCCPGPVLSTDV